MAYIYKDARGRYRIQYTDAAGKRRDAKGFTDLKQTKAEAARLEDRTTKQKRGIFDHDAEIAAQAERRALSLHIDEWRNHVAASGADPQYAHQQHERVHRILCNLLGYTKLSSIRTEDVQATVNSLMQAKERAISQQTASHIIQALKQFGRWLWKPSRRARAPMLDELKKYTVTDQKRPRAEYTQEQLLRLLEQVEGSNERRFNITGPDRAMLYRLAIATGFRRRELASLTKASFDLDTGTVTVIAGKAKNKREAVQALPVELVGLLHPWLEGKAKGTPLFNVPQHSARMIRKDLEDAGIEIPDDGKSRDFHCLRHTAITNWVRNTTNVKVAQELARHSDIKLTMRYTHTTDAERRETIARTANALRLVRPRDDKYGQSKEGESSESSSKQGGGSAD